MLAASRSYIDLVVVSEDINKFIVGMPFCCLPPRNALMASCYDFNLSLLIMGLRLVCLYGILFQDKGVL